MYYGSSISQKRTLINDTNNYNMRHFTFIIAIITGLSLLSCSQSGKKNFPDKTDTIQVKTLIKQVCKFFNIHSSYSGICPVMDPKDSSYVGMDMNKLKAELNILKKSSLFDKEFIDNYSDIVLEYDKMIKNKTIGWHFGELPPYWGPDPWCNCRFAPYNNPWDKILISIDTMANDRAILSWTWSNENWSKDFTYKILVTKIKNKWKVTYMQGFDFKMFTSRRSLVFKTINNRL
jgi:hypothetical protein